MTSPELISGTSYGPELLIHLRDSRRRSQLEERLRELIRAGTLSAGARMPSSRALADDLSVSRRLVVEAYAQLLAEGYLLTRPGAGTYVAAAAARTERVVADPGVSAPRFDFFPGAPDLQRLPEGAVAAHDAGGPARGSAQRLRLPRSARIARAAQRARRLSAPRARRRRRARVDRDLRRRHSGPALLARALVHQGTRAVSVEDPGFPPHRAVLAYAGLELHDAPVDEQGLDVAELSAAVVLSTPAHQCPTGVALSPAVAARCVRWAREGASRDRGRRRRRVPLRPRAAGRPAGARPDRIVYLGSASKTLAPALRLGWPCCRRR